ncbi:MAG: ABC transporter substrate-binding protein [Rhizobiaceae bacterium]|nr:ABC transporter substrate-binding protein [Rhizobiaceae bacterium]
MNKTFSAALAATLIAGLSGTAFAQTKEVKIGYVTTLTTGGAAIGKPMETAVNLAVEHMGGKMGDFDIKVIFGDDGFKPETGKQVTDKLVKQDNVDFVAGYIWSNVLLASRKSVLDAGKFLISSNAGPSPVAGKLCNENFFSTSWQNDQNPMAMGEVLNQRGVKSLYVMSPNYAAGKNMVTGLERTFKGEILGKDFTKWPGQLDFSAELAKAKASGAEAIFVFYPGKAGGAFVQQYQQAGLKGVMDLYTVFTIDAVSLPRFQKANFEGVLGSFQTMFWSPDMDNEQNKRFVASYKEKTGQYPPHYAAQAYDTMYLIKSAVEASGGDLKNMDAMRAAMKSASFPSVRGEFTYGNNNMPIQNFYLREVVKDDDGDWTTKIVSTVFEKHQDPYAAECPLK